MPNVRQVQKNTRKKNTHSVHKIITEFWFHSWYKIRIIERFHFILFFFFFFFTYVLSSLHEHENSDLSLTIFSLFSCKERKKRSWKIKEKRNKKKKRKFKSYRVKISSLFEFSFVDLFITHPHGKMVERISDIQSAQAFISRLILCKVIRNNEKKVNIYIYVIIEYIIFNMYIRRSQHLCIYVKYDQRTLLQISLRE